MDIDARPQRFQIGKKVKSVGSKGFLATPRSFQEIPLSRSFPRHRQCSPRPSFGSLRLGFWGYTQDE